MSEVNLAHRSLAEYLELGRLLRILPPDDARMLRPGDLLAIRYDSGRLTPDQFSAIAGSLEFDFPDLCFVLVEADEMSVSRPVSVRAVSAAEHARQEAGNA